ncbi:MAG: cyclophilin-like fold protein [bacterium]
MARTIRIVSGELSVEAELNDTAAARLVWEALPVDSTAETWGDEVYFTIPVKAGLESPVSVVRAGDIGYWPPGMAFCVFFGPTPASRGDEIRPASPVTIIGKVSGDTRAFKKVKDGDAIRLEKSG